MFTKSEQNKIIDLYRSGCLIDDLMSLYDVDEHALRILLKQHQIDRQYNKFSDELYNRIIYLYSDMKKTQDQICYDLLVSAVGIKKTLVRNQIPLRSSSECNRKYKRNSHYFDSIDTPNKAYILGLIYADGNNHRKHGTITIQLQSRDCQLLERIKDELEYEGPLRLQRLHDKHPNLQNQYYLSITDQYMSDQLERLGVVNAKSLKLTFPEFLPQDLYRDFWRGYFDGDGCIYCYEKQKKYSTCTVGTLDMCEHLSETLKQLGIKSNIYHHPKCSDNTFIIRTSANKSSMSFLRWLYDSSDIKLERKYSKYLTFCKQYSEE